MFILLTNDDGIQAPGIVAMYRELTNLGEVAVVAPETAQSATGHGITLSSPLLTSPVTIENGSAGEGFTGTAVDGRPADCVKLALSQLLPQKPDLVVSGINAGANVGIAVLYSGTVAAAIEAAFLGIPAIATSLFLRRNVPTDYARAARLTLRTIRQILDRGLAPGQMANINIPALMPNEEPAETRITRQCARPWGMDTYDRRQDPRGRDYYWNSAVFKLGDTEPGTDVAALGDKCISVTPLQFDLTDQQLFSRWKKNTE
jgi:5'-nucleotidase